jgi:hypothetical protein
MRGWNSGGAVRVFDGGLPRLVAVGPQQAADSDFSGAVVDRIALPVLGWGAVVASGATLWSAVFVLVA